MSNISCFVTDCKEPVTGQCQGYKGGCGQFYCATHSSTRLCAECASRKEADTSAAERERELQRLLTEYNQAAQQYYKESSQAVNSDSTTNGYSVIGCAVPFVLTLAAFIWGLTAIDSPIPGIFALVLSLIIAAALNPRVLERNETIREDIMSSYESRMPNFREFYQEWLKQKKDLDAKQLKEGLLTFVKVVGVGAAVANSYKVENNIRDIAKKTGSIAESTEDIARTVRIIKKKL